MRSTDYARASRALFCSVLLLSQHTVVDANAWVTGRSSRSSTLAVAAPGGRDRPIRDWKAMNRDAGKALEERKEKAAEKAEEVVEAVEQALPEVDDSAEDVADSLDLEQGSPQALAIMLGKVAVITTVGVIGAKKVVRFAKAFLKARKERSLGSVEDVSAVAATEGSGDEEEKEDEAAGEVAVEEVVAAVDDDDEEGDDEVTDVFATPDEDEEESENQDRSQREALSKATEGIQARAESELQDSTNSAGDEEGESDEGTGDGDSGVKYSGSGSGKGDVSYV